MANTVNILERTLAQVGDSTNDLHTFGTTNGRESVFEPLVVRITDHADDDNTKILDEVDEMALFLSMRHGEPFVKDKNVLEHIIHSQGQGFAGTFGVTAGVIDSIVITTGGTGFSEGNSNIVIDGDAGGGGDAVLKVTVADGVITAIAITSGGTGYTAGALVLTNIAPTKTSVLYPDFDYATFG